MIQWCPVTEKSSIQGVQQVRWFLPEDGSRTGFRNVMFIVYYICYTMDKSKRRRLYPYIIHYRQILILLNLLLLFLLIPTCSKSLWSLKMAMSCGRNMWQQWTINIVQRIGREGLCVHYRVQNSPQTVPNWVERIQCLSSHRISLDCVPAARNPDRNICPVRLSPQLQRNILCVFSALR